MLALNSKVLSTLSYVLLFMAFVGCKKEIKEVQVYDNVIFHIDTAKLYSSSADKTKQKSSTQYISIMYSDLFSKTISTNELSELSEMNLALGDKSMSNELTLSHYLEDPSIDKPSNSVMRNDVGQFVVATYLRFYQRKPTPYEEIYLTDVIDKDPEMTVEDLYTAFILSNEYYYY